MRMQAVILAGGLSRRLGGVPKAGLVLDGQTLLARTVDAAAGLITRQHARSAESLVSHAGSTAASIAVVGPAKNISQWLETTPNRHLVIQTQEEPAFAGPAAGIAAGLAALGSCGGKVLVLACDMPRVAELTALLVANLAGAGAEVGVMASDGTRQQPLAAIYPERALRAAVAEARAAHRLEDASVFSLVAKVLLRECAVPAGLTADIDTWEDARAQGIAPGPAAAKG